MNRYSRGIGLIEMMVAMTLGLIVVLGVTQIFLSAKNTYQSQNSAAGMQEDARFVVSKMIQEIRMVGMFGCLATVTDSSRQADFSAAFEKPITVTRASDGSVVLTLVTADVGLSGAAPTWNIVSDCLFNATAFSPADTPAVTAGQIIFPVRRLVYTYRNRQILVGPAANNQAALVDNVSAFNVSFGVARSASDETASSYEDTPANPALIRTIRLVIELSDPKGLARAQTFNVVASVRNRLL